MKENLKIIVSHAVRPEDVQGFLDILKAELHEEGVELKTHVGRVSLTELKGTYARIEWSATPMFENPKDDRHWTVPLSFEIQSENLEYALYERILGLRSRELLRALRVAMTQGGKLIG